MKGPRKRFKKCGRQVQEAAAELLLLGKLLDQAADEARAKLAPASVLAVDVPLQPSGPGQYRWFSPAVFMHAPTVVQLREAISYELGAILDDFLSTEDLVVEVVVRGTASGLLARFLDDYECVGSVELDGRYGAAPGQEGGDPSLSR